jgi:peptidoglycan/LPS O-acetylase OafA/YrhL
MYAYKLWNGSSELIALASDKHLERTLFSTKAFDFFTALAMVDTGISRLNGPLWSLFIEWWLYIAFMLIFLGIHAKKLRWIFYIAGAFPLLIPTYLFRELSITFTVIWAIGACYTLYGKAKLKPIPQWVALVALVFFSIWRGPQALFVTQEKPLFYLLPEVLLCIIIIPVLQKVNLGGLWRAAAAYSYSLYILHFPIALFVFGSLHTWTQNQPLRVAGASGIAIGVVIAVSYSSAKYLDTFVFIKFSNALPSLSSSKSTCSNFSSTFSGSEKL